MLWTICLYDCGHIIWDMDGSNTGLLYIFFKISGCMKLVFHLMFIFQVFFILGPSFITILLAVLGYGYSNLDKDKSNNFLQYLYDLNFKGILEYESHEQLINVSQYLLLTVMTPSNSERRPRLQCTQSGHVTFVYFKDKIKLGLVPDRSPYPIKLNSPDNRFTEG